MIRDCDSDKDFQQILEASKERPVFLFKHSTVCPMSKIAWRQFSEFSEKETRPDYWRVLVRENKELARKIAEDIEIPHESPQLILFVDGKAVWKASSRGITSEKMAHEMERLK